jgi:hypothetical protein
MPNAPDSSPETTRASSGTVPPAAAVSANTREMTTPAAETGETGESGGPKGPDPTRYGDWERAGRCIDF